MSDLVFHNTGYCNICEQGTEFRAYSEVFRGTYLCMRCRSVPRHRALMETLHTYFPNWRELSIHESSPGPVAISAKLKAECFRYTASQFDSSKPPGTIVDDWRNENLEQQTFANESFDLVITMDVFEHIFRPDRAIREIARTLRPGGAHIATVPLVRKMAPSRRRAAINTDGSIEYIVPANYHQNPIDPEGSLVTIDWGYDIANYFDVQSGLNTTLILIDNIDKGIRANYCEVLLSLKGGDPTIERYDPRQANG